MDEKGVNAPSQLIPLMRVEQTEGAHQNSDFDKGELSLVPEVFVNNRADATNITHVQVELDKLMGSLRVSTNLC